MNDVIVTRHKYHIVRSLSGCTVRQEGANGTVIETTVPADEDTPVFAHSGRWAVEGDENVTVTEVFKLAPYQKLRLLGVVGGNAGGDSGLPAGYKRVSYLESFGDAYIFIYSPELLSTETLEINAAASDPKTNAAVVASMNNTIFSLDQFTLWLPYYRTEQEMEIRLDFFEQKYIPYSEGYSFAKISKSGGNFSINKTLVWSCDYNEYKGNNLALWGRAKGASYRRGGKIDYVKIGNLMNLVAALDEHGAPCMFDLVSKKAYYSEGIGDFGYPGKEKEATTYSLRRPITYAQLTEHGVRRLYKVPDGFNGTKDEYAVEHGFKPLVKTEQPEEGYWVPQWTETEDEIVLEWVETEPPQDEFGIPEEL